MGTVIVPSQIAAELDIAARLERQYHEAIAVSDWSLVHLVTEEVNRRIGRLEGALNVRVPLQPDTHCSRCLRLTALRREIRDRFRSRVPVDAQRHP
jgi:hypothetical protein